MAANQHGVSCNTLVMMVVDWPWKLWETFFRIPFKCINKVFESRQHSVKMIFFFFIGFIAGFIRPSGPRCIWRLSTIQKNGLFVHPGKMTPGLPLLLFTRPERWMICWVYIKKLIFKKLQCCPKGKLDIKTVPVPAGQHRDEISWWIPCCKTMFKAVFL